MKWDVDKTDGVLWIASEAAKSLCGGMKKTTGICFTKHLCYVRDFSFEWCTLESENKKIGNFLVERFRDKKFLEKFIKDFYEFYRNSIKQLNNMDKTDFSKISNDELFSIFEKADNVYTTFWDWGFVIEPMDFVMPQMIESRLRKQGYLQKEISEMLAVADISYLNREAQELIEIAKETEENQEALLKKHAYSYRWLQSAHLGRKDIPFSYFEDRLRELKEKGVDKELAKLKNFKINLEKRKKEILTRKPVDRETKELLEIAEDIAPLHDRRKELFLRSVYTADTARAEIARRYSYTKNELAVFQIEDILKLRQGKKLDKEYAKELAKEALLYIDTEKGIWKYYSGKDAGAIAEKELAIDVSGIKELKGMCASPGKASGIVRIIHGLRDIDKMEKGNILVASMTKPEIAAAIKKAAAIVTDEGGVTCHAAIVSREFRIPCIIATKIASIVLKDGDLVEVDANKGVVRKIK